MCHCCFAMSSLCNIYRFKLLPFRVGVLFHLFVYRRWYWRCWTNMLFSFCIQMKEIFHQRTQIMKVSNSTWIYIKRIFRPLKNNKKNVHRRWRNWRRINWIRLNAHEPSAIHNRKNNKHKELTCNSRSLFCHPITKTLRQKENDREAKSKNRAHIHFISFNMADWLNKLTKWNKEHTRTSKQIITNVNAVLWSTIRHLIRVYVFSWFAI